MSQQTSPAGAGTRPLRRMRLVASLTTLAMVAVACGGSVDDGSGAEPGLGEQTTTTPATPDTSATTTTSVSTSGSPSASGELDRQVALATEPWETDFSNATIDIGELALGIGRVDPRDAIPPIDNPEFEDLEAAAGWLDAREPGVLVQINGEARFYALSILTRHEIVNDQFGDVPAAVTYCPLCNTAIVYDRRLGGTTLRFGVSGLLRNSDLVMWDDETTSLWQQVTGEAIVGERAGQRLTPLSSAIVGFGDVMETFPDAVSLSRNTGFGIAYGTNPYVGYSGRPEPFPFFEGELDDRFPALERVVGVTTAEGDKAYPFSIISEARAVNDTVGTVPVAVLWGGSTADALDGSVIAESQAIGTGIAFDPVVNGDTLTFGAGADGHFVDDQTGSTWTLLGLAIDGPLAGTQMATTVHRNEFWFAWIAFFPDAAVYEG